MEEESVSKKEYARDMVAIVATLREAKRWYEQGGTKVEEILKIPLDMEHCFVRLRLELMEGDAFRAAATSFIADSPPDKFIAVEQEEDSAMKRYIIDERTIELVVGVW